MQDNLPLHGSAEDLHLMGISPDLPFYDLNLAGSQGVPTPASLASVQPSERVAINNPTFTEPVIHVPLLAPHDLIEPGIDLRPEFSADPQLPDLEEYDHPHGLDIRPNTPAMVDPSIADLLQYDHPSGLDVRHNLLEPDPLLSDLQHPDLTQQVHMLDRPGDLDASALQVMHQSATYQQLGHKDYPEIVMDASGVNNTRSRHMGLLMRGLDDEGRW